MASSGKPLRRTWLRRLMPRSADPPAQTKLPEARAPHQVTQPPVRILTVGLEHDIPGTESVQFFTDKHFLDHQVVVFDPGGAFVQVRDYEGGDLFFSSTVGADFRDRFFKTSGKLVEFVNKGGLALVFLRHLPKLHIDAFSPETHDLNRRMPWGQHSTKKGQGSSIEFHDGGAVGAFWAATRGLWRYETLLTDPPGHRVLAHVAGYPDQVVADLTVTKERGFVVISPVLTLTDGGRAYEADAQRFVEALKQLHSELKAKGPESAIPEWADAHLLPGEAALRTGIEEAERRISELQQEIGRLSNELDALCVHKVLFTGYDSPLESAVELVLSDLGFQVERGPKGRVDLTATMDGRKLAVEVQGTKRGAKESHARSLIQWVQEVAKQDGLEPKGLLVVNPYRDTPLGERPVNNLWPSKTLEICEHQGYCAMTGLQLLGLFFDARLDDAKRRQLVDQIFTTKGLFDGYKDWTEFAAPVTDDKASED